MDSLNSYCLNQRLELKRQFFAQEKQAFLKQDLNAPYGFVNRAPFLDKTIYEYYSGYDTKTKSKKRRICLIVKDSLSIEDQVMICPIVTEKDLKKRSAISLGSYKSILNGQELFALYKEIKLISKTHFRLRTDLLLCENLPLGRISDSKYFEVMASYRTFIANVFKKTMPNEFEAPISIKNSLLLF